MDRQLTQQKVESTPHWQTKACAVIAACLVVGATSLSSFSAHAQIEFENVTSPAGISGNATESYGASWGDFNSDGYPDIFIDNHRDFGRLWRNNGDGTFSDISTAADVSNMFGPNAQPRKDTHGSAWADLDNDGDQDLATTESTTSGAYMLSNGVTLTDMRNALGLTLTHDNGSRLPIFFDFNNDGLLDVKVVGRRETKSNLFRQNQNGTFSLVNGGLGMTCDAAQWGQLMDVDASGTLELMCGNGAGFPSKVVNYVTGTGVNVPFAYTNKSRDAVTGDFDNNSRQDILHVLGSFRPNEAIKVAPNTVEAQMVLETSNTTRTVTIETTGSLSTELDVDNWNFIISRGGTRNNVYIGSSGYHPANLSLNLQPTGANLGVQAPGNRAGMFIGYVNGKWSISIHNVSGFNSGYFVFESSQVVNSVSIAPLTAGDLPIKPKLELNMNNGFVNATSTSGLTPVSCVSGVAADLDNDMDLDLFLGCRGGAQNISNVIFENLGNGTFAKITNHGAEGLLGPVIAANAGATESVISADYDADGFIDIFASNGLSLFPWNTGGNSELFRNKGNTNKWIEIDLVGVTANRDGVGAKVEVTAGGITQYREQNGGYHRWSQNHQRIHFGLGTNASADVKIIWPNGNVDNHTGVAANAVYRATEQGDIVAFFSPDEAFLYIDDVSVAEDGNMATFTVSLSAPSADEVRVDFDTADGTAVAGLDYIANSGQLIFPAQTTASQTIDVILQDDTDTEGNETFTVELSNPVNALLADTSGLGTIIDNEVSPCGEPVIDLTQDREAFLWRDCITGQWSARFTAGGAYNRYQGTVDSNLGFSSVNPVSIEFNDVITTGATQLVFDLQMGQVHQDGFDFNVPAGSNLCVGIDMPAGIDVLVGASRTPVTPPFNPDTFGPCDAGPASLTIDDVFVAEDENMATFTVSLSAPSTDEVRVDFDTADGTATAGSDYNANSGQLIFPSQTTSQTIDVILQDDTDTEGNETFTVELSNPVNALFADSSGLGTIIDNEVSPCGEPVIDLTQDREAFLWRDCITGQWSARFTAGGTYTRYQGTVDSSLGFSNVVPFSVEFNDIITTGATQLFFDLKMGQVYQDGFDFDVPAGSNLCVGIDMPVGIDVLVGAGRTPVTPPFNPDTFGACS